MENKNNGSKLVFDKILNNKEDTRLLWMLNIVYINSSNMKLTTFDDLLSWRRRFLGYVLILKSDVIKNSDWVDYVAQCGVTDEMIKNPEFHLQWIVKDEEYKCVLANWAKNCKVEEIKLDELAPNKKNLDDNFIKICKIIDRLIVNKSLQRQGDGINEGGNKELLNCVFGNESYKIFFEAIAKIEGIGEYFDNIDKRSCEDKEFQHLQETLVQAKVKLTVKDGSIVAEDYDYEKQKNEMNEIDDIKEDKNGLLWFFGIVGAAGIFMGGVSAVNCYVTPFLALLAFKGTAAILSVAIPGGIGALCVLIFIGLLIYRKNVTQKENTGSIGSQLISEDEQKDEKKEEQKEEQKDEQKDKIPGQDSDSGKEKNEINRGDEM